MASRTVDNLERMIPPSGYHLSNLKGKHNHLRWESNKEVKTEWSAWADMLGLPLPASTALKKDQQRRHPPPTHTTHHLLFHKT